MKIQTITNINQNISHKAYFKPNTEFKKIWSLSNKTDYTLSNLKKIKELNTHELEIIDSKRGLLENNNKTFVVDSYTIFNNTTKKSLIINTPTQDNIDPLETITNAILANLKTQEFFSKDNETDFFENFTSDTF